MTASCCAVRARAACRRASCASHCASCSCLRRLATVLASSGLGVSAASLSWNRRRTAWLQLPPRHWGGEASQGEGGASADPGGEALRISSPLEVTLLLPRRLCGVGGVLSPALGGRGIGRVGPVKRGRRLPGMHPRGDDRRVGLGALVEGRGRVRGTWRCVGGVEGTAAVALEAWSSASRSWAASAWACLAQSRALYFSCVDG